MIELVLRIGFSLLVVFGLMWGLAKLARRPLSGHRGTGTLSVLNRQQLSRGSSVAVVRVADRALILGVTDTQVSLLGETDPEPFEKHPERRDHLFLQPGTDLPAGGHLQRGAELKPGVPLESGVPPESGVGLGSGGPLAGPARRGEARSLPMPVDTASGRLDGSILSPRTWVAALDFLRDRTTRR